MDGFGFFGTWGMSGRDIYDNFKQGAGGSGLATGASHVQELVTHYEQRAESITKLTVKMESAWQGDAAGAARRGAGPLAVEHGLAAPEMNTAQDMLHRQVTAYDTANHAVMPIPPEPQKPGLWDNITSLGGANRTYEAKQAQVNAANDHNVSVMSTYEEVTGQNSSGMPRSYGSISPDYSAIGVVQPQTPPTPPQSRVQPPQPRGTGLPPGSPPPGRPGQPPTTSGNGGTIGPGTGGQTGQQRPPGTTDPGNFVPTPGTGQPGAPGTGGPGGPGSGGPGFGPGFVPGGGFGPGGGGFGPTGGGGGGSDTGAGGRGGGPGGRGLGGPGGAEEGGRLGPRGGAGALGAGGAAAAEAAAARGAASGAGGRGMGGMPMGGGGRGQGGEDGEHARPSFLVEADPDATFGTDEVTAPPVIGE